MDEHQFYEFISLSGSDLHCFLTGYQSSLVNRGGVLGAACNIRAGSEEHRDFATNLYYKELILSPAASETSYTLNYE